MTYEKIVDYVITTCPRVVIFHHWWRRARLEGTLSVWVSSPSHIVISIYFGEWLWCISFAYRLPWSNKTTSSWHRDSYMYSLKTLTKIHTCDIRAPKACQIQVFHVVTYLINLVTYLINLVTYLIQYFSAIYLGSKWLSTLNCMW
jgi:hypothetical protein